MSGFGGVAHYNQSSKTLIVAFAGSSQWVDYTDNNFPMARGEVPPQALEGLTFVQDALEQAVKHGSNIEKIVYTGHSLGGYIAQHVQLTRQDGSVVAFNSPGYGGALGTDLTDDNVRYVYSNPTEWCSAPIGLSM